MGNTAKPEYYDEFKCIADKCLMTCCRGWEIGVDEKTYVKWSESPEINKNICRYIRFKTKNGEREYSIKMGAQKVCPLQEENGLCLIHREFGEEFLPLTCAVFPRQETLFEGIREFSLTCSCHAVVDLIYGLKNKRQEIVFGGNAKYPQELSISFRIRKTMIDIMQDEGYSIKNKVLLIFSMLINMINKHDKKAEQILMRFDSTEYKATEVGSWSNVGSNPTDIENSIDEINSLFLDIVENYRKELQYRGYLREISEAAECVENGTINEIMNVEDFCISTAWKDFKKGFGKFDILIENVIVSKIFANCISDDIYELIMAFQIIMTEYLMIRYSMFLKWLSNGEIMPDYSVLKDYIVIFSRMIGYNSEGMEEFWRDSFDDAVLDIGYLCLLLG